VADKVKSSFCQTSTCIEVRSTDSGDHVIIGTTSSCLVVMPTREEWEMFLKGAKNGDFDGV